MPFSADTSISAIETNAPIAAHIEPSVVVSNGRAEPQQENMSSFDVGRIMHMIKREIKRELIEPLRDTVVSLNRMLPDGDLTVGEVSVPEATIDLTIDSDEEVLTSPTQDGPPEKKADSVLQESDELSGFMSFSTNEVI